MNAKIRRGIFDRYFLFHPDNACLAWSGSRWVSCTALGVPTPPDNTQVCNFESEQLAQQYLLKQETIGV